MTPQERALAQLQTNYESNLSNVSRKRQPPDTSQYSSYPVSLDGIAQLENNRQYQGSNNPSWDSTLSFMSGGYTPEIDRDTSFLGRMGEKVLRDASDASSWFAGGIADYAGNVNGNTENDTLTTLGAMADLAPGIGALGVLGDIGGARAKSQIMRLEPDVYTAPRVSTGSPTEVQANLMDFHNRDDINISTEQMRANPAAFSKNMGLMNQYPSMPLNARNPEKVAEAATQHISDNLKFITDHVPEDYVGRSGNWYKGANALANDISREHGVSVQAAAGVLARLSPGADWFMNVKQADRLIGVWAKHGDTVLPAEAFEHMGTIAKGDISHLKGTKLGDLNDPLDKAKWIRAYDESMNPRGYNGLTPEGALTEPQMNKDGTEKKFNWQSYDNITRAIKMLEDPSTANVSTMLGGGHKIRNFYNNIGNPFDDYDVTIDTHAVSAGLLSPYSQKGIPVGHNFGGGAIPGVVTGSAKSGNAAGTYGIYADAHRDAASRIGVIPQAIQSPTWETIRENFPTSGPQKEKLRLQTDQIWENVRKKKMTAEQGREAILEIVSPGKGQFRTPVWYEE